MIHNVVVILAAEKEGSDNSVSCNSSTNISVLVCSTNM